MKHTPKRGIFLGAMVGSTLGAITAMVLATKKGHKVQEEIVDKCHELNDTVRNFAYKPMVDKIGQTISGISDLIENSRVAKGKDAIEEINKSLPKGEIFNQALTCIATGINLWKKIKKGK